MPHLVLVDDLRQRLGPLSDFCSSHQVKTGVMTNYYRIWRVLGVRPCATFGNPAVAPTSPTWRGWRLPGQIVGDEPCLIVNGAWPAMSHADQIRNLAPHQILRSSNGRIVAMNAPAASVPAAVDFMRGSPAGELPGTWTFIDTDATLIEGPWDIIRMLPDTLVRDITLRKFSEPAGGNLSKCPHRHQITLLGEHMISISPSANVGPFVVFDASRGPIVVGEATIGAFSVITGPAVVGGFVRIAPHSQIRSNTLLKTACSVGGEVSHSIVGEFSHKSHAGYLGHSIVCSWANLGADTNVSNLKNTYGNVRMQMSVDTPPEDTGMLKMGAVIGHFTKTAIGTRLPTGACISSAVMLACEGFAPKFVPPFRFIHGASNEPYRIEDFLQTVRKVMDRERGDWNSAWLESRLRAMAAR